MAMKISKLYAIRCFHNSVIRKAEILMHIEQNKHVKYLSKNTDNAIGITICNIHSFCGHKFVGIIDQNYGTFVFYILF